MAGDRIDATALSRSGFRVQVCATAHSFVETREIARWICVDARADTHIRGADWRRETRGGFFPRVCVYRDASGISERRFRYEFMGPIFTTVGKFSLLPCISNVRRILICRIYCNKYPFEANVSVRRRIIVLLDISGQTYEIFLEKLVN